MGRAAISATTLLLLGGCGWSEDRYYEEKTATFCEQVISCDYGVLFNYEDVDGCIASESEKAEIAAESDCQDYDGVAAKACVEGKAALTCDELFDGEAQPEACDQICSNTEG